MSKEKKTQTLAEIISKRRYDLTIREGYINLIVKAIGIAVAAWFIFSQIFLLMQAGGNDMFPAIKDGDLVLAFRMQEEYAKDDVIVCSVNDALYVRRIIARESDVVTLDESGTLLVNGTAQSGEILYPTYAKEGIEYPYVVPEGHVFVLGDYRTQATDSRDFGPISMEDVKGKVITILRRREL